MIKKTILLSLFFFWGMCSLLFAANADGQSVVTLDQAKEYFSSANSIKEISDHFIQINDGNHECLGYIALSSPMADEIHGYGGPVPLMIVFDASTKIVEVKMLPNNETIMFENKVKYSGLLESWNGLTPKEAAEKEVDGVTGATFTSYGVTESMKVCLNNICNEEEVCGSLGMWKKNTVIIVFTLLAVMFFFFPFKLKKLRIYLLILSIILLGFWQNYMLSVAQVAIWLQSGISITTQWGLLFLLLIAVFLPLLTGKSFYCQYVCPFGAAQEIVSKLTKRKRKISQQSLKLLFIIRRAIFFFVLLIFILGFGAQIADYEPFTAFSYTTASITSLILAFISLGLSLLVPRPWCRFVCPLGQCFEFIRKGHRMMKRKKK